MPMGKRHLAISVLVLLALFVAGFIVIENLYTTGEATEVAGFLLGILMVTIGVLYFKGVKYRRMLKARKRIFKKIVHPRLWILKCFGVNTFRNPMHNSTGSPVDEYRKFVCSQAKLECSPHVEYATHDLGLHITHYGGFAFFTKRLDRYVKWNDFKSERYKAPTYSFLQTYQEYRASVEAFGGLFDSEAKKSEVYKLYNAIITQEEISEVDAANSIMGDGYNFINRFKHTFVNDVVDSHPDKLSNSLKSSVYSEEAMKALDNLFEVDTRACILACCNIHDSLSGFATVLDSFDQTRSA